MIGRKAIHWIISRCQYSDDSCSASIIVAAYPHVIHIGKIFRLTTTTSIWQTVRRIICTIMCFDTICIARLQRTNSVYLYSSSHSNHIQLLLHVEWNMSVFSSVLCLHAILIIIVNFASTKRMFYFSSRYSRVRLAAVLEKPGAIDKTRINMYAVLASSFCVALLVNAFCRDCK